jgi:hypothetical protein
MATRRAVVELGLQQGESIFALIKTVALDERMVAQPAALKPSRLEERAAADKFRPDDHRAP